MGILLCPNLSQYFERKKKYLLKIYLFSIETISFLINYLFLSRTSESDLIFSERMSLLGEKATQKVILAAFCLKSSNFEVIRLAIFLM